MTPYQEFYRRSIEQPEAFWAEEAKLISWHRQPEKILDFSRPPFAKWFVGGQTNLYQAGDQYVVPDGVTHRASFSKPTVLIDMSDAPNRYTVYR